MRGEMDCFVASAPRNDVVSSDSSFKEQMCVRILAAGFARALRHLSPPTKAEGAGKTGCALHPRSRVQDVHKNTHTSIQVQRRHPAFPAQWFTAYFALSPVTGLFATVTCGSLHKLDASIGAPGPHDFAVRISRARQSQPSRPPHLTARS